MKTPSLLTIGFGAALLGAVIGCSEPDVSSFQGTDAQPSARGDDDDSDRVRPKTKGGADELDDDDDDDSKASKGGSKTDKTEKTVKMDTTTEPTKTQTPEECFTRCVGPVPEAVALDTCTKTCADNDTECLGECYDTSNCGANPQCNQAIDQCGKKCPQK